MRRNTAEYRKWIDLRNRKDLKNRTRRKRAYKRKKHVSGYRNPNVNHIRHTTKKESFKAPINFSIINNPTETVSFFNSIISFIVGSNDYNKKAFIDVSEVESFTTDALMYLVALIENCKTNSKTMTQLGGNEPTNQSVKKAFKESGFYKFVHYKGNEPMTVNEDNIQIVSGQQYDVVIASQITKFVCQKGHIELKRCRFIYEALIELMNNTQSHAYNSSRFSPRWYCYVEYDGEQSIVFTFMDTGEGIPATVQKRFSEKIDFLKLKSDNKYVISALKGDFRTATKQSYRGKGLPLIRKYCTLGLIQDLIIITNKAKVKVNKTTYSGTDMTVKIEGTLYNWRIDLARLNGGE